MSIVCDYNEIKNKIIEIRRKIHMHPELSFEEYETAKEICAFLDEHNISYTSEIAKTGICALVGNPRADKCILIRADMDALPYEEHTGLDFASVNKGVMHACGHDLHIASALAACYILKKHESEFDGCVKIVFQPGEETTGGAKPMIDEGVLLNPEPQICIGAHVTPEYPTGELYFRSGALMASPDDFRIVFTGKSAHGAEPQNGINPIDAAAEFSVGIKQKLCEKIDFTHNVFTICSFNSGTANNIIPDTAVIEGTFRSFSTNDRKTAEEIMKDYAKSVCKKYGAESELTYNYLYPPLINDAEVCGDVKQFAISEFGKEKIKEFEKPLMTGEDFSYFALSKPSVFVWAGCAPQGKKGALHSAEFVADEDVIEICARLFAGYTLKYFNN